MPFVGDALELPGGELDFDFVELGDADQLLGNFDASVDGFVASGIQYQVTLVRADGENGCQEGVGAGIDECGKHAALLHEAAQVVENVGFSVQQVGGVGVGLQEFELERHGFDGVRGSEDGRILAARPAIPAAQQMACLIREQKASRDGGRPSLDGILREAWNQRVASRSISSRLVWRTSRPLTMYTTYSAMFLAWSPIRSTDLATNMRSIAWEIMRGSSIM